MDRYKNERDSVAIGTVCNVHNLLFHDEIASYTHFHVLVFWPLTSLLRNSVVLTVYLLFSVACHLHNNKRQPHKARNRNIRHIFYIRYIYFLLFQPVSKQHIDQNQFVSKISRYNTRGTPCFFTVARINSFPPRKPVSKISTPPKVLSTKKYPLTIAIAFKRSHRQKNVTNISLPSILSICILPTIRPLSAHTKSLAGSSLKICFNDLRTLILSPSVFSIYVYFPRCQISVYLYDIYRYDY